MSSLCSIVQLCHFFVHKLRMYTVYQYIHAFFTDVSITTGNPFVLTSDTFQYRQTYLSVS